MPQLTRTLNDGTVAPWLAFGTASDFGGNDPTAGVKAALEAGFTHLDTAQSYRNEGLVGNGLAGVPRDSVYVTTKIHSLQPGQTVREVLVESLKQLRLDYVDLYLIHSALPFVDRLPEIWKQFEELKKEGLTKSIGISNFNTDNLETLLASATVIPAVHQLEFHPYLYKSYGPLLELHKKYNIATSAYAGLVGVFRKPDGPLTEPLASIAKKVSESYGKPVNEAQILLKWLQAKDVIPVTASKQPERLRQFVEVQEIPDLSPEDVAIIDEAGAKLHYRHYNFQQYQTHMDVHLNNQS